MENKKLRFEKFVPHIVAVILFLIISFAFFYPQLQGKQLLPHDLLFFKGMSKEIVDYREQYGEEPLWTNSMFSGMPAYLISVRYTANLVSDVIIALNKAIGRPASFLFFSLLGFYIALLLFRINPWLAIAGSIAYAFSSYFFIILEPGHASKANALGYMAPIIASVYTAYKRNILTGAVLTALFLSIQLFYNHLQITYYTLLIILIFIIFHFFEVIKQKQILRFFKASGALLIGTIIALGINFTALYFVYDYGKDSIRGKSELTKDENITTSGLDKDYATAWSYGQWETFTLLIPNFHGGGSGADYENTEFYKDYMPNVKSYLIGQGMSPKEAEKEARKYVSQPFYWGTQPSTAGPVYVGAIVFFLFILGLFVVKGQIKWWLLTATIISIFLAWGKNMMWFSDLFFDYFPGYNKFRTVSMILVIAEFCMPLLAIITINKILNGEIEKPVLKKSLLWSFGITGGLCLIFWLMPRMFFDFSAPADSQFENSPLLDILIKDRISLFKSDAIRSFIFIALSAGLIYIVAFKKIKTKYFYAGLTLLFLFDMWPVNARYINENDFIPKRKVENPVPMTQADSYILQDPDLYYRVLNMGSDVWAEAVTSYYHHSIGGYHGAKMRRYQELFEYHISKEMNMIMSGLANVKTQSDLQKLFKKAKVINMLNAKYFLIPGKNQEKIPQLNTAALGNAWFVNKYKFVNNADEEINALYDFNPANEAIIDKQFAGILKDFNIEKDSTASIKLTEYKPNKLVYESNCTSRQLAVFSDIYYPKGWNAYVDGQLTPHFRANYVLRAMIVPAGKHEIVFKFEPKMFKTGSTISFASSIILIIMLIFLIYREWKHADTKEETEKKLG